MNPVPFTVRVKAAPPALVYAGEVLLMRGTGLDGMLMVYVAVATALVE